MDQAIKQEIKNMEDKEALEILMQMLEKHQFSDEEKKALETAIGILSWSKLGQGRIRSIAKARRVKKDWGLGAQDKLA